MAKVSIMGMFFEEDKLPDFGSIRLTKQSYRNVNEYILKSEDVSKLDEITNAADGSTAFCTDTSDLFILHMEKWVKVVE